jgi:serine/threonine protein kinase
VNNKWDVKVADFGLSRFNTDSNMATLTKMRGTFAYCAPEVYFGQHYATKSDIYSMGVVVWELVTRTIAGKYERPYAEFKHLQFDFQIIIQTAKKGLRPTFPPTAPEGFKKLFQDLVAAEAADRPECDEILKRLNALETEWKANQAEWEKLRTVPQK